MTTYALQLVPKGWKVVPEEPTAEMLNPIAFPLPLLNTTPVLRWDGNNLVLRNTTVAAMLGGYGEWFLSVMGCHEGIFDSPQEARRAAEKALGFPDGLIIPET